MEFRQLFKEDKMLMYQLEYKKNIKNITAKVTKDNKIQVTAPENVPYENVDKFILDHFEKFSNYIENRKENSLINLEQNILALNGIKYQICYAAANKQEKYEIIGRKVYFYLRNKDNKLKILMKFYNDFGSKYLIKRVNYIAKKIDLAIPNGVETRWYESKWGQCNINSRVITLANQLVMFNDEIIDYVIIHELCHLIHPNHSKEFWNLVEKYYPNYIWAREKLKFQC